MNKYEKALKLYKDIQQIDIDNRINEGKFIFSLKTRKCIKNEIERLSTIVQQPLSGSAIASPKSCPECKGDGQLFYGAYFQKCNTCKGTVRA